ncbi:asparagine synthase C-terminal domain-containing protein [Nitrososphaera sp.]|uniref:asparagine synthase C-terminal domain-containing protein n=1 Tax=Nitrososphaera sp. TaxID=1971748 RepID=UPI00307E5F80
MGRREAAAKTEKIIQSSLLRMRFRRASLLLSGGVDSVLTLAMVRKYRPDARVSCVSMGFGEDGDEIAAAKEIARLHDCDFCPLVVDAADSVLAGLPKLVSIVREPRWNLYQFHAFALARKHSRLIFSGDGADELFGGYTFRYDRFLSRLPLLAGRGGSSGNNNKKNNALSAGGLWKERARLYLECHERDWVPDQEKLFGPKVRFSWDGIYALLRDRFDNRLHPLDQVFLADYDGKLLYDWIPANAAFARFLDARITSLFLSDGMVGFATHIPWRVKYDSRAVLGKLPLRAILARQRLRVEPVKKGFSVDMQSLWVRGGRELVEQYVNRDSSRVVRDGVIAKEWLDRAQTKLVSHDVRYVNKMLGLLALEVWWRLFVDGSMKPQDRL